MSRLQYILFAIIVLAFVYVGSYLFISRRGYAEARQADWPGFYYFTPENSDRWRRLNNGCRIFFAPLNMIEQWLGTGMTPAHDPLWNVT